MTPLPGACHHTEYERGRHRRICRHHLKPLGSPVSQAAADQSYLDTVRKLADGLARSLATYEKSSEPRKQQVAQLWKQSATEPK